jgi:Ca2+-binding EF-hand superfamily protein
MGWSAWHEMWSHKVYQRNLLKKAAARLTKPKLIASYSSWRVDWERATVIARASGSAEQRLRRETLKLEDAQQELLRQRNEYEKKLEAAKRERETLLEKLSSLDGGAAEREAELRRKLEEEKERRIEQIKTMAAHRFGKQGLLRGWTQWHDLYTERVEKRRMLQSAAGRLLKPKLAHAYSHWNRDWLAARQAALAASASFQTQQLEVVLAERTAFQKENVRLNREREELLNKLSALDGGKAAAELEMQRQREEEKEKRIAHLQRMAARRILAKDLSRGMTSWIDLWFEKTRRQRLLRAASLRLTKPKLSAGYSSWKRDWELEALVGRKAAEMAKYASEDARNNTAMANVLQQRDELEERNAMLSTSLDEMRMAANRMAEELARALRGAHAERQQLEQLRKEAEAALEAERRAKEELSARQIKDAEAAAKMLRRMLDEQRSQLEGERHVIQKELLKEIDELRAKLKLAQARPPPVAVPAAGRGVTPPPPLIPYDKTKTVAQLLKEYLSSKNMRVMDLFRDFDADGSGEIDRNEWIAAWAKIGADFPKQVIEAAFDEFDPNKSGSIDFEELNKFLKKSLGIAGVLGLKKATNRPRSTSPNAEASDVHGEGRGDFRSNMQIKADDFFKADADGNSELGFDEFCNMVRMRDPEHDPTAKMSDEELKKLFVQLDLDGGGTVDLAEYVQWALQQALKESKGRVLELFNSWDDDKSGFIDVAEFHQALNGMGFGCSKADSAKVFKALDPDGSGKLDYRELNGAFRRIQRRAYALTSGGRTADKKPSPLGAKKTTPGGPKSAEKKK